jgi:MFS transporter, DHA1 family, multidrug resistance protein
MSSTRWQIEPPPLAPGAGAQWLIAALVALGPFSLTMYQPALPAIARSLNISTAQVQLTLTVYLASFAIGQLIYGPMSDHFGRRRTLLVGLAIFVVGAVACALASSAGVLIAARVLQGLGACAGPALGRAMIRDLYGAKGSAKAMAFVASALSIAPAIAPVFGGYIAGAAGWPWIFAALTLVGTAMFVFVLLRVPETNPYVSRGAFRFVSMLGSYIQLGQSRRYLGYLSIAAVTVAGSLSFQTAAPFIIVGELGVHPSEFGWLMVSLTAAYFVGTLVANRLAVRVGVNTSIMLGCALLLAGAALQLALALNLSLSTWSVLVPQMIWLMAMGILMPNAMAGAVSPFPTMAGAAASLQGFAMMAAGALSSLVLSGLGGGVASLALMMCALAAVGTAIFVWANRQGSATRT